MRTNSIFFALTLLIATGCANPAIGSMECHVRTPAPAVDVAAGCSAIVLTAIGNAGTGCTPEPARNEVVYVALGHGNVLDSVGCVVDSDSGQVFRTAVTLDLASGGVHGVRSCTEAERQRWAGICE